MSVEWNANDALAKTDYGLPAPQLPGKDSPAAKARKLAMDVFARASEQASKLPRNVLIAIAAGIPFLILGFVLMIILLARGGPASTAEAADGGPGSSARARVPETRASPEKLQAATAQGAAALEKLAGEFPEDPAVQTELARSLAAAGRTSEMLQVVARLAKLDKSALDEKLLDAVEAAATRADTMEEAFALLEGPLGARGVDTLIELSSSKSAPPTVQRRAAKSITRADVRANASPAAGVMLDLKAAKRCEDKRDLLGAAKESGDARILSSLKAMKNPRGCGFMGMRDCYSCLRKDDSLEDAITAVEARSSK